MQNQSSFKSVNLLFGSACNLRCGYCLQQEEGEKMNKKGDSKGFASQFLSYLDRTNTKITSLHYWGGEPMLYWKIIKAVYEELQPVIQAKRNRITTNGTLITDEYVDFCNQHPDIFTVVSFHDGDISPEQWKIIGRLENFSIEALIHHKRVSPLLLKDDYERICELIGKRPPIGFDMIKANNGCHSNYWMTHEDVIAYFQAMMGIYELANFEQDLFCKTVIAHFLYRYQKELNYKGRKPNPCVNDRILSVDLFGNTYNCHHNNSPTNITGNIFKPYIPIKPISFNLAKFSNTKECQNCETYASCGGGCYTSNTHDADCLYYKLRESIAKVWLKNLEEHERIRKLRPNL
ncbi:radical SAM/SPASM domain-containing protein [Parasutterella muris]|uniref:SPASM domain-containing protein n=1 Tax=Parasutterella muris TaxID=2565572 RepID=A0A6L6YHZ9_9BURK|nr:SPASM domain-containing protein [Parasutterella muris]MVX56359.1 SPASM domain-containing protein [Parasutterella muris]